MPNDKNRKLWPIIVLIILASIIAYPIVLNQLSSEENESGDHKATATPNEPTSHSTPTHTSTPTSTSSGSQDPVRFTVYVDESNIRDCGMTCREVPAKLKNTGDETAHNVDVEVRFYCDGDRIDVNGQEYVSLDLGTLEPGESETRTEEIDVGFGGGLCIQNNGARIVFTVTSDEKTMTLEETYNP